MTSYPNIQIAGENALIVYFGEQISESTLAKVSALSANLTNSEQRWIIDLIPSYNSLLVVYDALNTDYFHVKQQIQFHLNNQHNNNTTNGTCHTLEVYYGSEAGPDFDRLCELHNLSSAELISLHTATTYLVYAIGFAPGFAFLGQVDGRIATPRLSTPRKRVAPGSVGIADNQTAVYPNHSAGGWNLIGLCPNTLFDMDADKPSVFSVGDSVQFTSITRDAFIAKGGTLND